MTRTNARRNDRPASRAPTGRDTYASRSTKPLHILVFLIPIIAAFELGLAFILAPDGTGETIRARRLLGVVFENFGVSGLYVAPVLILVLLVIWHVVRRDPWRVEPRTVLGMAAESAILALPLLVLAQIVAFLFLSGDVAPAAAMAGTVDASGGGASSGNWSAQAIGRDITKACGAGLYEEFVFRLVGIAAVHLVAADLLRLPRRAAAITAIVATALAFAFYHDLRLPDGSFDLARFAFLTVAGAYFGAIYLLRGFGVAVGVHVVYDIFALRAAAV